MLPIKQVFLFSFSVFSCCGASAEITVQDAANFLQKTPPRVFVDESFKKSPHIENLTKLMFDKNAKVAQTQGYTNFKTVLNEAHRGNAYAAYNAGIYMMLNQQKFDFEFRDALLLLKKGSDGGVLDSKYSLALIYMNRSNEVAQVVNSIEGTIKTTPKDQLDRAELIKRDSLRFQNLSQQYVLELASRGHEKAYLMACNYYVRGEYLPLDSVQAAVCYNNAVKLFDSPIAMGLLARLYFDDSKFNDIDFEKKGIELAKNAMAKGNVNAMAILGKQAIFPKHLPYSDLEFGVQLIKQAALNGDSLGRSYVSKYFDNSGRLYVRPTKPIQNGYLKN